MTPETVTDFISDAVFLVMMLVSVMVVPSLLVGLMVSVFQAATQINEQTLSFLPRLLVTLGAMVIAGPWMLTQLLDFFARVVTSIPQMIG